MMSLLVRIHNHECCLFNSSLTPSVSQEAENWQGKGRRMLQYVWRKSNIFNMPRALLTSLLQRFLSWMTTPLCWIRPTSVRTTTSSTLSKCLLMVPTISHSIVGVASVRTVNKRHLHSEATRTVPSLISRKSKWPPNIPIFLQCLSWLHNDD